MRRDQRIAWLSGLTGFGLVLIGAAAYWHQRRATGAVGIQGLGRGLQQVDSFSDGNMKTETFVHPSMPIEMRIDRIQKLVRKSTRDPEMRKVALQATSRCPERDQFCEARAVFDAVKSRVRYTGDIGPILHEDGSVEGIDLYQAAKRTWEFRGGDCDDQAILNATLLAMNGIEPRLRVVKQKRDPDWSHIYAGGMINGKFVALDTTLPGHRFNVEGPFSKKIDFPA
jgi:transglutaminase-like putative cysteine protease